MSKAIVFLADGLEECEGLITVDILRRAGVETVMASIMGRRDVKSSREILIQADCLAENVEYDKAKMIVLPGGRIGTENLGESALVIEKCKKFVVDRYVAAVCAAPSILAMHGLVKKATVHPDFKDAMGKAEVLDESVVVDENVITGQGLGATIPFALELVKILVDDEKVTQVGKAICYHN